MAIKVLIIIIIYIINSNGILTVYPPGGVNSPVKDYNIKNEKLQYTTKKINT